MFGATHFEHSLIKKMLIVFGYMFNDITITRKDSSNNLLANIKVPIQYAKKEKMLARLASDPELNRNYAAILPKMSFEILNIAPDRSRKLQTVVRKVVKDTDLNKLKYQYNPVPYNITFALYVYVKNPEDGTKIIEQILPFFTPDWTASVEMIEEMNEYRDIPYILDSVVPLDLYSEDLTQRQVFMWQLNFTCKTYLYGPVKLKPVIKFSEITWGVDQSNTSFEIESGQVTLTANGEPTSNVTLSIDANNIAIDDDWGYGETITRT